jgi:hypothetical protein
MSYLHGIKELGNNVIEAILDTNSIILRYELNPLCPHITQKYNTGQQFGGINSKIYHDDTDELLAVIYCDSSIDEDILIYKNIGSGTEYIPHIVTELLESNEKYFDPYLHYNIDFEYIEKDEFHYDLFHRKAL